MLKERIEAGRPVAQAMHGAEEAYNVLLERLGTAFSAVAHARQRPGIRVPLETGMAASIEIARAAEMAATGYQRLVAGHRHLGEDLRTLLPSTVRMEGDIFDTPPALAEIHEEERPKRHLQSVNAA